MRKAFFLLLLILAGAFIVRLYKFNNPIADWHAWRQADTSAVSRNFVSNGFDVLRPRFDDISNVPSGRDNPQGYRFVEFPLYNVAQAGLFVIFDKLTLEEWGRIITIFANMLSIVFLYLLVKKYANNTAALFTAFFFAFIPYSIYYGRVILPDPAMVSASLGGIYFFDLWLETEKKGGKPLLSGITYVLAVLFTAEAFLFKPYAIFFTLPLLYLSYRYLGWELVKQWKLWLFVFLALVPLVLWRLWMQQFPEGIPASDWLFNAGNIRFKGSFFQWIFADRIGRLILGYWGLALLVLGVLGRQRNYGFFFSFLLSCLLYITVIARGNVQHDYYQILIIPTISIFLGLGVSVLLRPNSDFSTPARYASLFVCSLFLFMFGWFFVRDYYNINNPSIVTAGKAVDQLTPKDARVIALYDGDTSFLYQTKRKGWASFERSLAEMEKMGADYLVIANPKREDFGIAKEYPIVSSSKEYLLFDLHRRP